MFKFMLEFKWDWNRNLFSSSHIKPPEQSLESFISPDISIFFFIKPDSNPAKS